MTRMAASASLPGEFRVGSKPATQAPAAEWLLRTSEKSYKEAGVTDYLREVVAAGVALVQSSREAVDPAGFSMPSAEGSRFPTITGEDAHTPGGGGVIAEG